MSERAREIARDVGPDCVALVAPQPIEGEIGHAEILDRELLFRRHVVAVVLLGDPSEGSLHLWSGEAVERSRAHLLDCFVEQGRVAAEGLGEGKLLAAVAVLSAGALLPRRGGGGTRMVSSLPAMNSEIESCIASPR